jgi:alpha-L-fucosidase
MKNWKCYLYMTVILFVISPLGYAQQTLTQAEASARYQKEKDRHIGLPKSDTHYEMTESYIEETPDSGYFHASEEAYESFKDMKFGVRIHWGIYSIWQMDHESWGFLDLSNEKKQEYQQLYKTWNPTAFSADAWMDFFQRSGLKCFAITSKHHDGFSLFNTQTKVKSRVNYTAPGGPAIENCDLSYSMEETPFHRDIIKELCESAHRHNIKIDLYFSHPDWYDADFRPYNYHPLQTEDAKRNPLNYGDSNSFEDSKVRIMVPDKTPEETARMIARHRAQLKELLTNYGNIDMICLDQWLGRTVWPEMKETIKMARSLQPNTMFRCRGIGNYGDYYTPEGFVPGSKENTNMPWMVIYPLASTFSYDKEDSNYKGSPWIIYNLVDAVAKGGNFMVGIGPDGTGKFHPKAVEQLEQTGSWLKVNGEGIYGTRAAEIWKEGDSIRYTSSKDKKYFYAFALSWPGKTFTLHTMVPAAGKKVYMLGYAKPLDWTYEHGEMKIRIPDELQNAGKRPCKTAWGFRMEGVQKKEENLVINGDFSNGNPGEIPANWTLVAHRQSLAPSFRKIEDQGEGRLLIQGTGRKDVVGYIKSKAPVVLGKTYQFTVRFKISQNINPQRNLLFECITPDAQDGIFTYTKKADDWIEGTEKITLPGKGNAFAEIRVLFRFSDSGQVSLDQVSLRETAPDKPRWVKVACTSGVPKFSDISKIAATASAQKTDILLLPEYMNGDNQQETLDGPSCTLMSELARKYHMYIAGGIVRKVDSTDRLYNTVVLYDREGHYVTMYDKIHPYSPEVNEEGISPGHQAVVVNTDFGRVGFMTCYDSWFTDVAELVSLKGAELVLFPNAGYYRSLLPARAADNKIRIIASSLYNKNGIWSTDGRDASDPNRDPTVSSQKGVSFKDTKSFQIGKMNLLVSNMDFNFSPSPAYNGGTMSSAPGGRRNRRDQLYYPDEDIQKEKARWWTE